MSILLMLSKSGGIPTTFMVSISVQKRSADGGKQGASIKKLKKDKAVNVTGKTARPEANSIPTAPRVKPELALPVMYFQDSLSLSLFLSRSHFSSVRRGFNLFPHTPCFFLSSLFAPVRAYNYFI